jgi:hypothetical protein
MRRQVQSQVTQLLLVVLVARLPLELVHSVLARLQLLCTYTTVSADSRDSLAPRL